MKINEIQDLIKFIAKSGVSEVSLETKDFKVVIKTSPNQKKGQTSQQEQVITVLKEQNVQVPLATSVETTVQPSVAVQPVAKKTEDATKHVTVKSPMIGTFYRSPAPEQPPFVNIGDNISKGQVIGIIEAMKLFNEIESDVSGKILKILTDNAAPVEYNQALFLVEPI